MYCIDYQLNNKVVMCPLRALGHLFRVPLFMPTIQCLRAFRPVFVFPCFPLFLCCFRISRTQKAPGTLIFVTLGKTISNKENMGVLLKKRKNPNGTTSLRLHIYHGGKRWFETLTQLKLQKPTTPLIREQNKEFLRQAEEIRVNRAAELQANEYSMASRAGRKVIVVEWMQAYHDKYEKKDKRNIQGAINRFKDYLKEKKRTGLTFGGLTPTVIEGFITYLEKKSKGEGAKSYYKRWKKMVRAAYRQGVIKNNPLDQVSTKIHGTAKRKDILTLEEIQLLAETPVQNPEIRRAFLFSCVTGLRWVDVKTIKWQNIKSGRLDFRQSKTGEDVTVPLNDTAKELLGKKGKPEDLIFDLPSANGANKTLKAWVKRAKIDKEITWHNARHSFGTALIFNDVDVLTTSKLMGHKSLTHTQRYVRAAAEMKQKATDKLNIKL